MRYLVNLVFKKKKISPNKVLEWFCTGFIKSVEYDTDANFEQTTMITTKDNKKYVLAMKRHIHYPTSFQNSAGYVYACASTLNAKAKVSNKFTLREVVSE